MSQDEAEELARFMDDNDASFIWVPQPMAGGDSWMVEGYDGPYGLPESEVVVTIYHAAIAPTVAAMLGEGVPVSVSD